MLKITCDACAQELSVNGALLFGPPDPRHGGVLKMHLCQDCYRSVLFKIQDIADSLGVYGRRKRVRDW